MCDTATGDNERELSLQQTKSLKARLHVTLRLFPLLAPLKFSIVPMCSPDRDPLCTVIVIIELKKYKFNQIAVTDPDPPRTKIFLISCSFSDKFGKFVWILCACFRVRVQKLFLSSEN